MIKSISVKVKSLLVKIISTLLVILFTYAALSKLMDYSTFKYQLGRSPYVTGLAGFVAWALPVGELLIAIALVFSRTLLIGLYASFLTMLMFTGYIYAMLHYSYFVPCSCGGILSKMGWTTHLWFNTGFTVLALIGVLLHRKQESTKPKKTFNHIEPVIG
jgi:hypothetical protein